MDAFPTMKLSRRCSALVLLGLLAVPVPGQAQAASVSEPVHAHAKPQAGKEAASAEKKKTVAPAAKAKTVVKKPVANKKGPAKAAKSADRKKADAIAAPLPNARLDLRLPPDMVEKITPVEQIEAEIRKPLLPSMFNERPGADSPFQLNGRLLSNEMQLQLRNDSRQDVEGAAIDFEFKQ